MAANDPYVWEKLYVGVRSLAQEGTLEERLDRATSSVTRLSPDDFPGPEDDPLFGEDRGIFERLRAHLRSSGSSGMTDEDAALALVDLFDHVARRYGVTET